MLPVSPAGRRYGYQKDKPDHRDFGVRAFPFGATSTETLPPVMDLEPWCGPVKDQKDLGACTAFAGCGMREFLFRVTDYRSDLSQAPVLSPMFLYYMERKEDGSLSDGDTGSSGRTSCKAMNTYGVCLEIEDQYSPSNFDIAPTDQQISVALKAKSGAYHRLHTVQDMRSCLVSRYVFVVGFMVYESFETKIGSDGVMPMPAKGAEAVLGGHEVLFIGYDDSKQAFKVRNSWGAGWGQGGNFWFPYQAVADQDILQDAWIQHLGKPW